MSDERKDIVMRLDTRPGDEKRHGGKLIARPTGPGQGRCRSWLHSHNGSDSKLVTLPNTRFT